METAVVFAGAGVILSLLVAYVPGFKQAYEKLDPIYKQIANLGFLFLFVGGAYMVDYFGYYELFETPFQAVVAFVTAMIANAGTYQSFKHIKKGE